MVEKVRVGIIGAGRIGRLHAEHLVFCIPEAEVLAVSDVVEESAQKCASDYGIPHTEQDHHVLMENPEIDAVIICSSTDTHTSMIEEASESGKHIFCEKPIDFDLKRIDKALEKVKQSKVKFQVGFNRRFDSNFRKVREFIEEGKIGVPHTLHIISRDPQPPPIEYVKISGGIFIDMTIHDFDMARYLIGNEVEEVYAIAGVMIDPEIGAAGDLDTAIITFRFNNGVIGTINNSRQAVYGYDQRVEVFGSKGVVKSDNNTPTRVQLINNEAAQEDLPLHFFMDRYSDAYLKEMKEFINCIINDIAPSVTGVDGRIPVVMGKAARISYDQNRPVKLNEVTAD